MLFQAINKSLSALADVFTALARRQALPRPSPARDALTMRPLRTARGAAGARAVPQLEAHPAAAGAPRQPRPSFVPPWPL